MRAWLLTSEVNEYHQHGEYFEAWFHKEPTADDIQAALSPNYGSRGAPKKLINHILSGGGRVGAENVWYKLRNIPSSSSAGETA